MPIMKARMKQEIEKLFSQLLKTTHTPSFNKIYKSICLMLMPVKNLILEMVQGTRIPWKAGKENKLGLSGLNDLFRFAPWTHIYLGVHIKFIIKIGKPCTKCNG